MKKITYELWADYFGLKTEVYDYAGNLMRKSDIFNQNSPCQPTIDHIRPLSKGGTNDRDNLIICSALTNQLKADKFPTWTVNNRTFQAKRKKGTRTNYEIYEIK